MSKNPIRYFGVYNAHTMDQPLALDLGGTLDYLYDKEVIEN
jgi:hypothetical protein